MGYTLGDAAKATGKSKGKISKAIKKGRISAAKKATGEYDIDPSELHRVYPSVASEQDTETVSKSTVVNTDLLIENRELQAKLDAANQRAKDAIDQVHDLREDRDKWRQQATALLTDQSTRPASQEATGGRLSRAWSILWGKG